MISKKFIIGSIIASVIATIVLKIAEPEIIDFKNKVRENFSKSEKVIGGKIVENN